MLQLNWTKKKKKNNQTNNAHENRQVETRHEDLCSIKESINLQIKQDNETNAKLTNEHDLEQKHFEMALSIDIGIPHAATRFNFFSHSVESVNWKYLFCLGKGVSFLCQQGNIVFGRNKSSRVD